MFLAQINNNNNNMPEGQRRYVIDAHARTSRTLERKVPVAADKKNGRAKQKALVEVEVLDVKDIELRASEFVSKMNPDQTLALRSYMDGLDAVDSAHKAMVAGVREDKKTSAAGEMNTKGLDAMLEWKDAMNELKSLEREAKDAGINLGGYDFGRKNTRDTLRTKRLGLQNLGPDESTAIKAYINAIEATDRAHTQMVRAVKTMKGGPKGVGDAAWANVRGATDAGAAWQKSKLAMKRVGAKMETLGISQNSPEFSTKAARMILKQEVPGLLNEADRPMAIGDYDIQNLILTEPVPVAKVPEIFDDANRMLAEKQRTREISEQTEKATAEPRPLARVNRGPDERVIRKTVVDMRPVDQRPEDGPAKVVPAPQPKSAWGRAKSWMSGTPVGKAARWLGIGLIGLLGPYQDVEDRPQAEPSAMMAPVQEGLPAASVSVGDENDTFDAVKDVGAWAGAGDLATGSDQLVVSTPDADALVSFDAFDSVRLADYEYSAAEIERMRSELKKHAKKIGVTGSIDANVAASFLKLTPAAHKAYFEAAQETQKAYLQGIVDRANADALAITSE